MFLGSLCSILVISRPKLVGVGEHWGVQLADGHVAHCSPTDGVCITSIEDFAQGKTVKILREVPAHLHYQVAQRLHLIFLQPRPYDLVSWNCETFANWLTGEKAESQQVNAWYLLALIALVARLAA
mgnify:CR=1 FL=1